MSSTFVGIDPGFKGAIGALNSQGCLSVLWDIPLYIHEFRKRRKHEINVQHLDAIFRMLTTLPDPQVILEWPTTRPGEEAEASKRFGVGLGQLEALCAAYKLPMVKLPPNKWKMDLGLPGKKADPLAARKACDEVLRVVPDLERSVVFGPRGGPLDGRAEALLIAWWKWSRRIESQRILAERWGRGSLNATAFCLQAGSARRRRRGASIPGL